MTHNASVSLQKNVQNTDAMALETPIHTKPLSNLVIYLPPLLHLHLYQTIFTPSHSKCAHVIPVPGYTLPFSFLPFQIFSHS